ncbi:MAG TPA: DUF72 domain-containing protein [Verrucomicrobiae bacterium]|jgi:uncharacterized protein YecE (DUF72 family)
MIWIGTSGFQYPEWKGKFYPAKLPTAKMLAYYAERFTTTESNYTFRSIPSAKTIANWLATTPERFRFALKAPQRITHIKRLIDCGAELRGFFEATRGLGAKLGPVLFQLPPNLKKDTGRLNDFLALLPDEMRAAFEFRHESWFSDDTFEMLKSHGAALCIADSEKLSTPVVMTAKFGYFRLRDEGYGKTDLKRWAETIARHREALENIHVYFKHEERGLGPEFAQELQRLLG